MTKMGLIVTKPSFTNVTKMMKQLTRIDYTPLMHTLGRDGVRALANATPVDTGRTKNSWRYTVVQKGDVYTVTFINDSMTADGKTPIVILLEHGHATRAGTFVHGSGFIGDALEPVYARFKQRLIRLVEG